MRFSARLWPLPVSVIGLTMTGCSNGNNNDLVQPGDVTESAALTAVSADECLDLGNPVAAAHAKFDKRCHHYRHRFRPKSYQAGQAQMTTRALMDVNKVTLVEATTGTFDDGTVPPGWFDHVRIRIARPKKTYNLDADGIDSDFGDPTTKNGYFSVAFPTVPMPATKGKGHDDDSVVLPALTHGQQMRITGVIKGVDPRTAVITIDDQVRFRPDLSVSRIDTSGAVLGSPSSITAVVQELKGDLGAVADCVLSVDGAVADIAKNIWVDASGTVSCQFAHTFTVAGKHALHVDVSRVRPADYDMRNNGADATITIGGAFAFSGSALDGTYTSTYHEQVLDPSSNVLFDQSSSSAGRNHCISINGAWPQGLAFPLATTSVNATSAGATWNVFSATNFAGALQPDGSTCASGPDATGWNWVSFCSAASATGPVTQVVISEFAGQVTYHSDGTCLQTSSFYDCTGGYTWNFDGSSTAGVVHSLNGSLTEQINVTDAMGQSLAGTAMIPLQAYSVAQDQALTCVTGDDGTRDCTEQHYSESGMKGSVGQ